MGLAVWVMEDTYSTKKNIEYNKIEIKEILNFKIIDND